VALAWTDTTVLNNFAQIRRPDLLRQAFAQVGAPRVVRAELSVGEQLGRVPPVDWSWLQLCDLTDKEQARAAELETRLQAGEAACLALAEARGGLFLSDDGSARRIAASLQVQISGTVGILARLLRSRIVAPVEADALLAEMIRRGYRSPTTSLRDVLPFPLE